MSFSRAASSGVDQLDVDVVRRRRAAARGAVEVHPEGAQSQHGLVEGGGVARRDGKAGQDDQDDREGRQS